jgi:hypothetical protein
MYRALNGPGAYPQFQITDVWKKDDPPMRLDVGETEDW